MSWYRTIALVVFRIVSRALLNSSNAAARAAAFARLGGLKLVEDARSTNWVHERRGGSFASSWLSPTTMDVLIAIRVDDLKP